MTQVDAMRQLDPGLRRYDDKPGPIRQYDEYGLFFDFHCVQ